MNRHRAGALLALVLAVSLVPSVVRAATIQLSSPLSGALSPGDVIDLTVSFDLNGAAPNIVTHEFYVRFTGLVPDVYAIGSVYDGLVDGVDFVEGHGVCDVDPVFCGVPPSLAGDYQSLVAVLAPVAPTGPGSLFSLRFLAGPSATSWTIDVLGEDDLALISDDGAFNFPPMPFAIVTPDEAGDVGQGTARVQASVVQTSSLPVPEPSALVLTATAFGILLARHRVRSRTS